MALTVPEVKSFVVDAQRARSGWLIMAEKSWNEIKKISPNRRMVSISPNSTFRRSRYPAWYSIYKIRQPLLLSRVGIPIGRDTTQDGNDNVGATAAICFERLVTNLAKNTDFFDTNAAVRDDFLTTNVGQGRLYYERDEIKQKVKEYIEPVPNEDQTDVTFISADGEVIESDDILEDDDGFFIEHDRIVEIENEKICFEPVLYKDWLVDPDIRRYNRCRRMAFVEHYSEPEFIEIFGKAAFAKLPKPDQKDDQSQPKKQTIKVYEYWDAYEKEVVWLPDLGEDFVKPLDYLSPYPNEDLLGEDDSNGLYNLDRFFPCPDPLIMNQSTDEFWPVPEYYQLQEIFQDIHTIFARMVALTRGIRVRLMFDNNVEGLQAALNEAAEGDCFGIANLTQALVTAGGKLDNVVQYIPVKESIEGLNQLYLALEQRLNIVYKLTGTSDLLQGLITDGTQRTLGERQMTEKYALNQLADPQRKMQEFVRGAYQLMGEMAIKNFKDASLDRYIMPSTLDPDDQKRYKAAMGLLKNNLKRFRIELETDSTIAINEQYDKQMRVELVNALTVALEKTANIAAQSPALVKVELHAMKFLVQGFRQGKLFQSEITEAIDNVIAEIEETPQPFNKDEAAANLKQAEIQAKSQTEQAKIATNAQLEQYKISVDAQSKEADRQLKFAVEQMKNSLETFKAQMAVSKDQAAMQLAYQKLGTDMQLAQENLSVNRDKLYVEMSKVANSKDLETFRLMLDKQVADSNAAIESQKQMLEQYWVQSDMEERWATEERLQAEHEMSEVIAQADIVAKLRPEQPKAAPISLTIQSPTPIASQESLKVKKDEFGNVKSVEAKSKKKPVTDGAKTNPKK